MSNADPYFQFPLCLLAAKGPFKGVMEMAIGYSVMRYFDEYTKTPYDEMSPRSRENAFSAVREALRFDGGELAVLCALRKQASAHIVSVERDFGKDSFVRLRTSLVFEARDGKLHERDFRVLAAIYSAIGDKPFQRVSWSWIKHRAAGCKSKLMFDRWEGRGPVYKPKALRVSVERLGGFFARFTFCRSQTYYSNRMDRAALVAAVEQLKTGPITTRSEMDASDSERIKAKMAEARRARGKPKGNINTPGNPTDHFRAT